MNPLIENALKKQISTLRKLYLIMIFFVISAFVATFFFEPIDSFFITSNHHIWLELSLAILGALVLGIALPLSYKRLTSIEKIQQAGIKLLTDWGLPPSVDPVIGKQAVYITRYTAGCVLGWTMTASVGLYGLVVKIMGSHFLWTLVFFLISLAIMLLIRPSSKKISNEIERLS